MPFGLITWRTESPFKEVNSVVKSERTIIIFDVVLTEEVIELLSMLLVMNIDLAPFESICQFDWLGIDFIFLFLFDRARSYFLKLSKSV